MKCLETRSVIVGALVLVVAGVAWADTWPPLPGQTGSITVLSAAAQNGAEASVWGFYTGPSGWVSTTFGTGTFSSGNATVNYAVPANFVGNFYWNITVRYSATSDERGQYYDAAGAWDQFFTGNPNGQTVTVPVYQFDQKRVTTSTASFRASVQAGTVFPPAGTTTGYVTVRVPWTGTMAEYTASGTGGYYVNPKTSLLPTRLASRGYLVDVLEGDPGAIQQFQRIRLHNADYSYSVDLFGYKNASTDDPLGYLWWTTLIDVATATCSYNETTGVFTGSFGTTLATGVMYFVVPEFDVMDSVGSTTGTWVQAGRGTDLLLSGASFIADTLALDATPASLYVKPTETVLIDMNVTNLSEQVNGCQAVLNFSSTYFVSAQPPTAGAPLVAPGGGVWSELLYNVWTSGGDLDVAVGVDLTVPGGTQADGTVAKFTLTPTGTEGATQMIFRPDGGDTSSTFFSGVDYEPVWPNKVDSASIVIDGTAPLAFSVTASTTCTKTGTDLTFATDDDTVHTPDVSGISHYELFVDAVSQGQTASPHTLNVGTWTTGSYQVVVRAHDRAGNYTDSPAVLLEVDQTAPAISNIVAEQGAGNGVLCPEVAVQGLVDIYVDVVDDGCADLVVPPTVDVDGIGSATYIGVSGDTYHYQVTVLSNTANGSHQITVTAEDALGNSASDTGQAICVDKNQVTGTVAMQTLSTASYAFARDVLFTATDSGGTVLKTWTVTVNFTNAAEAASGTYSLTEVPADMAGLSAKTNWSLREKKAQTLDGDGQAVIDFTGADQLRGGDLNSTNTVNILDYSIFKDRWGQTGGTGSDIGDINGDGAVQLLDYSLLKSNWFKQGDAQ